MIKSDSYSRRVFGPFYWVPFPVGIVSIVYAGVCLQGYWATGDFEVLAMGIGSLSIGVTLTAINHLSHIVAIINLMLAALAFIAVAHSSSWMFVYFPVLCLLFAVTAFLRGRISRLHKNN